MNSYLCWSLDLAFPYEVTDHLDVIYIIGNNHQWASFAFSIILPD